MKILIWFLILIFGINFCLLAEKNEKNMKFIKNEKLKTIDLSKIDDPKISNWRGNPVNSDGTFINLYQPFKSSFWNFLKWRFSKNPQAEEKKNDKWLPSVDSKLSFLNNDDDCIVWLGHASFFIRLDKKNILIDPVFYSVPFTKKFIETSFNIEKFVNIDYLLISHDHGDHCNKESIEKLIKLNPQMKIFAGLNMQELLSECLSGNNNEIQTAGWFQEFYISNSPLKVVFLPARHWSRRGLLDENERLWGSFIIQYADKTIYFGADTGYSEHFKLIAKLFNKIDYAILGIGAYSPRYIMETNHMTPEEATRAFIDLKAACLIPMHYATFDLSDEPISEPLRRLDKTLNEKKISDKLIKPIIGKKIPL